MAVLLEQSCRQNSAYRSGCFQELRRWWLAEPFTAFGLSDDERPTTMEIKFALLEKNHVRT